MPDRESRQAAMYGPLVLAARFEQEPQDKWYRHFSSDEKKEPSPTLQFKGKQEDPASWLETVGEKLAFRGVSNNQTVTFVPLSSVVHERYSLYHDIHESYP